MSDMTDEKKNTLLLNYAEKGLTGGVLMAIQAGADANHKDRLYSRTALHLAVRYGKHALAHALLGAGADINAKDSDGRTPLTHASSRGHREVEALLRQHGAE
jgi:ankyrin repeat protein